MGDICYFKLSQNSIQNRYDDQRQRTSFDCLMNSLLQAGFSRSGESVVNLVPNLQYLKQNIHGRQFDLKMQYNYVSWPLPKLNKQERNETKKSPTYIV